MDEGWEAAYREVVRDLFEAVDPGRVAWVSLGTLRFPPRFLERWGRALRGRRAFFQEFVPGEDGKLRYFWPLRRQAYRWVAEEVHRWAGRSVPVYLCMESETMWSAALGWKPGANQVEERLTRPAPSTEAERRPRARP